jgi:hypothetical protein
MKRPTKLVIRRETLRALASIELLRAAAGDGGVVAANDTGDFNCPLSKAIDSGDFNCPLKRG